jgi:putative tricarboxylic transport membrane protein
MTISDGDWGVLFGSPLAIGLWTVAFVGFVLPIIVGKRLKKRIHMAKEEASSITD